ncbi:MAG: radical SAM protein [Nitrososphaerota archaeon]|jgi:pyrroloquinoline quinone biosynthesis protein E|nr:radical SAM protein [Nitrososphaerota archaeon]
MTLEELDLYLTDRCNLNCDFCSVQTNETQNEISFNKITDIILEAKKFGLEELHLTGGEPTLRNDLEDIIRFAILQGLNVRLITNGTLLNKKRLEQLTNCGLKSIMISLDGMEKYHDSVRGNGTYCKTLQTIFDALALGMIVRVNSVAWSNNRDEIIQLSKFLNDIGVQVYSVFLGSPLGYAKKYKENIMNPIAWKKFCLSLQEIVVSQNYKTKIVVEKGFLYPNDEQTINISHLHGRGRGCYNITNYYDYLLIRSNGNVYPCVFFSNDAQPIGNIYDQTLENILHSFKKNDFYEKIGQHPTECEKCEKVKLCNGGCRGYAKLYNENWTVKDPRCELRDSPGIIPLCPIVKHNLNEDQLGGSSEQVLRK